MAIYAFGGPQLAHPGTITFEQDSPLRPLQLARARIGQAAAHLLRAVGTEFIRGNIGRRPEAGDVPLFYAVSIRGSTTRPSGFDWRHRMART
jgi:hypothetical protein